MRHLSWPFVHIDHQTFALTPAQPVHAAIYTFLHPQDLVLDLHYEPEVGVVVRGGMYREYDGWRVELSAGGVWFTGIWEPHGRKVVGPPCEVLVLTVMPELLVSLRYEEAPTVNWMAPFAVPPDRRPQVPSQHRAELSAIVESFRQLKKWPPDQQELRKRLLLTELLLLALCGNPETAFGPLVPSSYTLVNRAIQLVLKSRTLITAQQAARECHLSRNRFNSLFQELMGLSFAKFALRYRLGGAAAQLLGSGDALKTIASKWGFTDAAHLTHCFRRHFGCSPGLYRRRPHLRPPEP